MDKKSSFCLRLLTPASWYSDQWKDALPAGNGKSGISVYGAVKKETIMVTHCNLWHWGKRSNVPDVTEAFAETRELLQKGEYRKANPLTAKALLDAGYESDLYKPCPVGDIRIDMKNEAAFSGYERTLNMESGEIVTAWNYGAVSCVRKVFVSRIRDMIFVQFQSSAPIDGMDVFLQLHETFDVDTVRMRQETDVECGQDGNVIIYQASNKENGCFGIVGKILEHDGTAEIKEGKLEICGNSSATMAFKIYGSMDTVKTAQEAVSCLTGLPVSYEQLLSEHATEHSKLFHSAEFELEKEEVCLDYNEGMLLAAYQKGISNEFCEKLWNYGRYLFISGTRPDMQPFPMYGLWGGRYDLLWSHNMANINIQMMYWHCVSGGYAEYLKAVIDYYCNLLDDLRENARQVFGMNGIYLPAGTTPGYGLMNQVVPVIVNWIGGAGWIAQHMYEYYLATGDEEILHSKILPFMEETALFYEEYLLEEDEKFVIMPSVSPENTPGNLQNNHLIHMAHANPTAKNATMDVAILKELFTNLIEVSQKYGLNQEKIVIWKNIVSKLPKYQINSDGAVKEWLDDSLEDFYYHRHFSHLYPVFPGKEMMCSEDEELNNAFKKAVELRVQGGQSGWSLVFQSCLFARLADGNQALECLDTLARGCLTNSFLSLHNDWRNMGLTLDLDEFDESQDRAPVQLDASIGVIDAIQEMILQYAPGKLLLLPALPDMWECGRVSRFGFFGGYLDMEWNLPEHVFKCVITGQREQELRICLPEQFKNSKICVNVDQKNFEISEEQNLKLSLTCGGTIEITVL